MRGHVILILTYSDVILWIQAINVHHHHHHHHHQSLIREGRWGSTDAFATSFLLFFPVLHCPLGLSELQACPFPDVVFPPLRTAHVVGAFSSLREFWGKVRRFPAYAFLLYYYFF